MTPTIYSLLAIFGLAMIVADSKITLPLRAYVALRRGEGSLLLAWLECPLCQSWWYGLLAGLFILDLGVRASLAFACVAYAVSLLLYAVHTVAQKP